VGLPNRTHRPFGGFVPRTFNLIYMAVRYEVSLVRLKHVWAMFIVIEYLALSVIRSRSLICYVSAITVFAAGICCCFFFLKQYQEELE